MVGLWSPDPPPEPENLEENNPGYLLVVIGSDEEYSDEGYEGYEPLFDADDLSVSNSSEDENDGDGNTELNSTDAPDSDCDTRARLPDVARCTVNSREISRSMLPASEGNIEDTVCSSGSSTGLKSKDNSDEIQAGPSNSQFQMGEQQVADVMAAMANVTLPPSAVPQWASVVPEDQWIQHILARVKDLQNKSVDDN